MDINTIKDFKICRDYKREEFDFEKIQWEENNPVGINGYPIYPYKMPSSQGSSYTYKLNNDWFFKRKLQDGGSPTEILSQHHFSKSYNELLGTFDDLAEVLCYHIFKDMVNPKTNEPLFMIPEYKLATYTDKNNELLRGCISKNVCGKNDTLITISDILKELRMPDGNTIDHYMSAINAYCNKKQIIYDEEETRNMLIAKSYACWKTSNSDNHKNNIYFITRKNDDGSCSLITNLLLDNGSSYELCTPYVNGVNKKQIRIEKYLYDDNFSVTDENGNRKFSFIYYPEMHNAFNLNTKNLLLENYSVNDKTFGYEYALASEMLTNPEIYGLIFEVEKQFNIEKAISEVNFLYGLSHANNPEPSINWPPLLKDFIRETNNVKSNTLALILADYYTYSAFSQTIGEVDRENPSEIYKIFNSLMLNIPLQNSKQDYDDLFYEIAKCMNIEISKEQLSNIKFKKEPEANELENQPS